MSRGSYKHILQREMFKDDGQREQEVREMLLSIHLNLAQGSLKNNEFFQATEHCGRALEIDPKSTKALYRKALGQNMGSLFDEAKQTLRELLGVEPENAVAKQMLLEIDRNAQLALKSGKKAAKRMVTGMERDPRSLLSDEITGWRWFMSCVWCQKRWKFE
ncbi:unnamed protein product [Polarella glacialis]|uniref:Peptidylprolyl isomerase n=1 Tax=Polarella glacialis TaxID=89957 RepID=A0A813KW30_POLGL|nr:unnamed protein product [Polarella glacialis]CAE8717310.1 unnamed protein product [Polarella glacialis]